MEVTAHQGLTISVHDQSQVGEARRAASLLAGKLGLNEDAVGRVSLVATEASRNLWLHGGGGEIVLTPLELYSQPWLELLALDRGRGMQDIHACMRDGYSTTGTPGNGLGAIVRVADSFDVYSAAGKGTVLLTRFKSRLDRPFQVSDPFEYSALSTPRAGEDSCGDAWAAGNDNYGQTFLIADGLGHGHFAEVAAREAVRVFNQLRGATTVQIIDGMHGALRSTRGAAVAVARVDLQQRRLLFAGVGNISAQIFGETASRNLVSMNGTVGHQMHKVQEFVYPWDRDSILVLHSDGLGTRWDLNSYPGLDRRSPGVIAGVLYRDFKRNRDDVTVLVARQRQE